MLVKQCCIPSFQGKTPGILLSLALRRAECCRVNVCLPSQRARAEEAALHPALTGLQGWLTPSHLEKGTQPAQKQMRPLRQNPASHSPLPFGSGSGFLSPPSSLLLVMWTDSCYSDCSLLTSSEGITGSWWKFKSQSPPRSAES